MKTLPCLAVLATLVLPATAALVTLETQHVDLSINFNASLNGSGTNPWLLTARDEDGRREFAGQRTGFADDQLVRLLAGENSRVEVPDDPRYTAFLGAAGTSQWILPQGQEPGVLYAGISTENKTLQPGWTGFGVSPSFLTRGVSSGVLQGNQVTLTLAGFSGPGDFRLYSTSAFGDPMIYFNTADGLSLADARIFSPGNHVHFNWAFSAPGEYVISLQASAVLTAGGQPTASDVTSFHFTVVPEPSALAVMLTGAVALLARRRRA